MFSYLRASWSGFALVTILIVALFAPMIWVDLYGENWVKESSDAAEVTVGIAVILRATARRFMHGATSNLVRTTAGAFSRTAARAVTRRFVKFSGRIFFGSMVRDAADQGAREGQDVRASAASQWLSLAIGYVALCLSFRGVLYVADAEVGSSLTTGAGLGQLQAVLLAGVPLLAYALLHTIYGRLLGIRASYRTEPVGLLLQAYFTGAGSFLPLTTDVEYSGAEHNHRWLATASIVSMFALHVGLSRLGGDSAALSYLGGMFLVYSFVYAFPIEPLEGHAIWASSKLLWLVVAAPILYAFLQWLPPAFGEVL